MKKTAFLLALLCTASLISVAKVGGISPTKVKELTCVPNHTSCGKMIWACGETTQELLESAQEGDEAVCGG